MTDITATLEELGYSVDVIAAYRDQNPETPNEVMAFVIVAELSRQESDWHGRFIHLGDQPNLNDVIIDGRYNLRQLAYAVTAATDQHAEVIGETMIAPQDPPTWDDRKELLDLWQDHAPLPDVDLRGGGIYDALLAVANWGYRRALDD